MAKNYNRLSRPAMRKLKAGDKINEHGITFERQASGDGVFTVNVMVDGQRIHRVIGRESDGRTRTQARCLLRKLGKKLRLDGLTSPRDERLRWGLPKRQMNI